MQFPRVCSAVALFLANFSTVWQRNSIRGVNFYSTTHKFCDNVSLLCVPSFTSSLSALKCHCLEVLIPSAISGTGFLPLLHWGKCSFSMRAWNMKYKNCPIVTTLKIFCNKWIAPLQSILQFLSFWLQDFIHKLKVRTTITA